MVDGLTVIGFIGVMLLASVRLTLTLLVMVPLVGALVYFVGLRYRRISRRIQGRWVRSPAWSRRSWLRIARSRCSAAGTTNRVASRRSPSARGA